MTAKELLLELLKRQKKQPTTLDWDKLEPKIENNDQGGTDIVLYEVDIGFSFDKNGRFLGIYNWKE